MPNNIETIRQKLTEALAILDELETPKSGGGCGGNCTCNKSDDITDADVEHARDLAEQLKGFPFAGVHTYRKSRSLDLTDLHMIDGKLYRELESDGSCTDCDIAWGPRTCSGPCTPHERADRKHVIFKAVNKYSVTYRDILGTKHVETIVAETETDAVNDVRMRARTDSVFMVRKEKGAQK